MALHSNMLQFLRSLSLLAGVALLVANGSAAVEVGS